MKNPFLAIVNPAEIGSVKVVGPLVWASVTGKTAQVAARFGVSHGRGRFSFTQWRWRSFLAALRPVRPAAARRNGVGEAVLGGIASAVAGVAATRAARRVLPNNDELAELSHDEARLGSSLPHEAAQVLRELSHTFHGGQAFTRAQLAQELSGRLVAKSGRALSPAGASIAASKALSTLETRGLVRRIGRDLNRQGRPGAERFLLTLTGEDRALGDQIVAQESAGESLAASEIARREALAAFLGPRAAPGKGPVYRPVLHRKKTRGHALPPLTKKRIQGAGYRTRNPPIEALPGFEIACERYEHFHGVSPTRVRRVRIDDGKTAVTRKVVVALGTVPVTTYQVPFDKRSNKHLREEGQLVTWEHDHPKGGEPLEVLDPETELTFKIPGPKTRVRGWWEG